MQVPKCLCCSHPCYLFLHHHFPFHPSCLSVSQTNARFFSLKWKFELSPPDDPGIIQQTLFHWASSHLSSLTRHSYTHSPTHLLLKVSSHTLLDFVCATESVLSPPLFHLRSARLAEGFAQMSPTSQKSSGTLIQGRFFFQNNIIHVDINLTFLISEMNTSLYPLVVILY